MTSPLTIDSFKNAHGLTADFGVANFISERPTYNALWTDLTTLESLREDLLQTVPGIIPLNVMTDLPDALAAVLRTQLVDISGKYMLSMDDIDLAVLDFRDMLLPGVYKLIELSYLSAHGEGSKSDQIKAQFDMPSIWTLTLGDGRMVEGNIHKFEGPKDQTWEAQLIYNRFGPIGLLVYDGETEYSVADESLAFPAQKYMHDLVIEVANRIAHAFGNTLG